VTVSPDLSPSAIHASLWVNPRNGTDAALALGLVRALLDRNAVDEAYVREQTDLPFLVRDDTGRFLRQSDVHAQGSDDIFYVWDVRRGVLSEAPGTAARVTTRSAGGLEPVLTGRFEVRTRDGAVVKVRPVFDRLRDRIAAYTPAYVAEVTGVGAGTQARLAEVLATSPRILIYPSWGSCKAYHAICCSGHSSCCRRCAASTADRIRGAVRRLASLRRCRRVPRRRTVMGGASGTALLHATAADDGGGDRRGVAHAADVDPVTPVSCWHTAAWTRRWRT